MRPPRPFPSARAPFRACFSAWLLTSFLACFLAEAEAALAPPPTPTQALLFAGTAPPDLRRRLLAHADSAAANPADAGEAWYFLGRSWARGGQPDSALAAFDRARALRGNPEDVMAVADLLLTRGARDDAARALGVLQAGRPDLMRGSPRAVLDFQLLDAWARALTGDPEAVMGLLKPRMGALARPHPESVDDALWAKRLAPIALERGERDGAWRLIEPPLLFTRGRDAALLALAREASLGRVAPAEFDAWLAQACARADSAERFPWARLGIRALAVRAEDGAALHAWLLPGRAGAPLAIVALPPEPGGTATCDSLVIQLRRAGLAVALLDPRGSRNSASAACESPEAWRGREEAFQRRLARDLGLVRVAAARAAAADPTRAVVVGVGHTAMAAVLAAESDSRLRAVLLAGPAIEMVDRGWVRASLAASGAPVFFETGPADIVGNEGIETIAAELPARQVRVADARAGGYGAELFRAGPAEGRRFADWFKDALKTPRATPPSRPR
jgi:hypothetical protein